MLIDIPIGLKEEVMEERRCDKEARKLLKQPRSSSVFRVPCRQAVYMDLEEEARKVNKRVTNKGFSRQTWNIMRKIREVDEFLHENPDARKRIREIHPEVLFYALNDDKPMKYNKKRQEGFRERVRILCDLDQNPIDLIEKASVEIPRSEAKKDDFLDALAASITAWLYHDNLRSIPNEREEDPRHLPMEMVIGGK
jgi:predicted RNase H-like nuclease